MTENLRKDAIKILEMMQSNEYTMQEIAYELGMSYSAVKQQVYRLRKRGLLSGSGRKSTKPKKSPEEKPQEKDSSKTVDFDQIVEKIKAEGYPKKQVRAIIELYTQNNMFLEASILLGNYAASHNLTDKEKNGLDKLLSFFKSNSQDNSIQNSNSDFSEKSELDER